MTAATSPITKTSGDFGTDRSWFDEHPPGLVGRRTKRAPKRRRSDSCGPDHRMARDTPLPMRHAGIVDASYHRIEHQFRTDALELPLGVPYSSDMLGRTREAAFTRTIRARCDRIRLKSRLSTR